MNPNYVDTDSLLRSNSNSMFVSNGFSNFARPTSTASTTANPVVVAAPILTPALDQFLNRRGNGDASAAQNVIEELERNSVIRYEDLIIGDSIGEGYARLFVCFAVRDSRLRARGAQLLWSCEEGPVERQRGRHQTHTSVKLPVAHRV